MFQLDVNVNRSGKASAGATPATPSETPRGCEIAPFPEGIATILEGKFYLFNWGPGSAMFITPQQYLDGVEMNGDMSLGVYAMVCHDDPKAPGVQVAHYLMRVHGVSAPFQSSSGESVRSMYAEIISCPGGGGPYDYIYMPLFLQIPADGSPLPTVNTIFRPSYDQFYWPGEGQGPIYQLNWVCNTAANELKVVFDGEGGSYNYRPVMLDAADVSQSQRADGCFVHMASTTSETTYLYISRLFMLVAATKGQEGADKQFWLGFQYMVDQKALNVVFITNGVNPTAHRAIEEPCKVVNYNVCHQVAAASGTA